MRPRWGGSERARLQFGSDCADTKRFDTAVPAVLAGAARDVGGERENWASAFTDPLIANRLDRVYAGYADAPGLSTVQQWIADGRKWRSVRLKRNAREGEVATAGPTFARGPMERVPLGATGTRNRLVVQSWRGRVNVFVNGRLTVTEPAPAKGEIAWVDQPDARVGFGGYADDNRCEVRFRNVQLRRLSAEPAPPPAGEGGRQVSR